MFGEAFQNRGQPNSLFSTVKWMPDFTSRKFYPTGCSLSLGKPAGGHRFQQDNDPKHTRTRTTTFMEENDINWWKTPPELPDRNPIELLWHELKHFLRNIVKPKSKDELVAGISRIWYDKVSPTKCQTYIVHLHTVLLLVVAREGKSLREIKCTPQKVL